ncbi:MAG: hypothetical protein ACI8Z5_002752 [Lentimonas sp.]
MQVGTAVALFMNSVCMALRALYGLLFKFKNYETENIDTDFVAAS